MICRPQIKFEHCDGNRRGIFPEPWFSHESGGRPKGTAVFVLVEELGRAVIVLQLVPVRQIAG